MSNEGVRYCKCGSLVYLDTPCTVCAILKTQQTRTKESAMTTNEKTTNAPSVLTNEEKVAH